MLFNTSLFAQSTIDPMDWYKGVSKDSIKRYKIFYENGDSTYVDTTLNIHNYHKHNLLHKDNIKLQRFGNTGENYNFLSLEENATAIPEMGFKTKHFNYRSVEDVKYFNVPTPITELEYKTGYYRGQFLNAQFSANFRPNLNFAISYQGLRSIGRYKRSLTSQGNLLTSLNYIDSTQTYRLKAHFAYQDLFNEESGGIEDDSLFITRDQDFTQRKSFNMNLASAETMLKGKRFYVNHSVDFPYTIPFTSSKLFLNHIYKLETKYFLYKDIPTSNKFYYNSEVINEKNTVDSTGYYNNNHDLLIGLRGKDEKSFIKAGIGFNNMDYSYSSLKVINDNLIIPARIYSSTMSYKALFRLYPLDNLKIQGGGEYNYSGRFKNSYSLKAEAELEISKKHELSLSVESARYYPDMQFWLYQSNYISYNYHNNLNMQTKNRVTLAFRSNSWFDFEASLVDYGNYTYFKEDTTSVDFNSTEIIYKNKASAVEVIQDNSGVRMAEFMIHKDFKYGVFGWDSKTIIQKELSNTGIVRVPELLTRNSIYYNDYWFRKALELNTGFSLTYYTEFSSMKYNPLIASYYLPFDDYKIGNYPYLSFFFNARVRTARIYFEIENIGAGAFPSKYFAAPHYPYADLTFRFGVVWNFFT
jgi:hypothetical protein